MIFWGSVSAKSPNHASMLARGLLLIPAKLKAELEEQACGASDAPPEQPFLREGVVGVGTQGSLGKLLEP